MTRRSRFGCQTCKIRRVKCDETQPSCRRCTETGRQCEGPVKDKTVFVISTQFEHQQRQQSKAPTTDMRSSCILPIGQPTLNVDLGAGGRRAFSFFAERAGPALGGELDQAFWHTLVLQLCQANSTVRSAVLALSTLCENPLSDPMQWPTSIEVNFSKPQHRQAFRWYGQSLNHLPNILYGAQDKESLHLALVSCILFACIEVQQLNVVNSMALMRCGYSLLGQPAFRSIVQQSPLIRYVLLPIFIRQTTVLALHGYPLPLSWLPVDRGQFFDDSLPVSSFQEARTQLFLLMLDASLVIAGSQITFDTDGVACLHDGQSAILARFGIWRARLDDYILTHGILSPAESRIISLLWSYYFVATVWLSACLDSSELVYDAYMPQFGTILDNIEAFLSKTSLNDVESPCTYTFEMRTIPPLYFVGWKCRDPHVRRRALHLLKRAPSQESLFHRDVQIWALRKIIEIEENLEPTEDRETVVANALGALPPEDRRLKHAIVYWDTCKGKKSNPCLVYSEYAMTTDEEGRLQSMTVAPLQPQIQRAY